MMLILTQADWDELQEQASIPQFDNLKLDDFEEITGVPAALGKGCTRSVQLLPGVGLNFYDCEYQQDMLVRAPAHKHDIQIGIHLSGFIYFDAVHPNLGGNCGYFSGSGMSPAYVEKHRAGERLTIVGIDIEPDWLVAFLQNEQYDSEALKQLFRGEAWKAAFYPTVKPAMRSIAQQLWNAPYRGAARRLYLQAKVFELLAMHLDWLADALPPPPDVSGLKPETIAALHQVKAILTTELEHPPSTAELAQQMNLSDRTLQRGFQALFGTTIVGCSMQQRLNYAEHLLRQGDRTVAEVARFVGYGHLGYFATIFKQRFGMMPSECLAGKKSVL
ncbi:MAG: helix-turn-helix transcriptional regulator [Leptolyngbyaceae cyanobacterium SM1_4_3]|nr:helix-turn-helix transcriptional regulator [Leptolyngbyaceae cyanobacterium SM1_4_3]